MIDQLTTYISNMEKESINPIVNNNHGGWIPTGSQITITPVIKNKEFTNKIAYDLSKNSKNDYEKSLCVAYTHLKDNLELDWFKLMLEALVQNVRVIKTPNINSNLFAILFNSDIKEIKNNKKQTINNKKQTKNSEKTICKGIGGYNLGDKYEGSISNTELAANGYWIKTNDFKSVGDFNQWAEIAVSPKTHTICAIALVGPKGKIEYKTYNFESIEVCIGEKELMNATYEAICNFYAEPKFKHVDLTGESEITWENATIKIRVMQPTVVKGFENFPFKKKDLAHYQRLSGYHYLECGSEKLLNKCDEEIKEYEKNLTKEKASEIDLSGLN